MRRTSLVITALVLFCAVAATAAEIVVVKPTAGVANLNPVWSPNGKSIAYVSKSADGTSSIVIAAPAGAAWKTRILQKGADCPVWSPDSKQIACRNGYGMVILDAATGKEVKRLIATSPDNVNSPNAWSPTGRHLLYTLYAIGGPQSSVMDLKTGKIVGAVSGGDGGAWTNAGKLIGWMCEGDWAGIKLADPVSGSSRTLVKGSCAAGASVPKGDTFAYVWITKNAPKGEGLYKLVLKTGVLAKMVALRSEEVIWSKDGAKFACVSKLIPKRGAEPEMCLYLGNTKDWSFKVVTKGIASPAQVGSAISWSPDGKSVVCATGDGGIKIVQL